MLSIVRETPDGIFIRVRLTPKASAEKIDGIADTPDGKALKAKVRAKPVDNAANDALCNLIAKEMRIPKSSVTVASGSKSRLKIVAIRGPAADLLESVRSNLGIADQDIQRLQI